MVDKIEAQFSDHMVGFVEFDAGSFDLQAAVVDFRVGGGEQDAGVCLMGGGEHALFLGQDSGGLPNGGEAEVGDRLIDPGGFQHLVSLRLHRAAHALVRKVQHGLAGDFGAVGSQGEMFQGQRQWDAHLLGLFSDDAGDKLVDLPGDHVNSKGLGEKVFVVLIDGRDEVRQIGGVLSRRRRREGQDKQGQAEKKSSHGVSPFLGGGNEAMSDDGDG